MYSKNINCQVFLVVSCRRAHHAEFNISANVIDVKLCNSLLILISILLFVNVNLTMDLEQTERADFYYKELRFQNS